MATSTSKESDMFNLMEMGLKAQEATVKANRDAEVFRIVRPDETLHAVMLEAIRNGAFVWANAELKRTVISKVKPNGEGWVKVHGTYSMPVIQQFVESADDDNDAALAKQGGQ